MKKYSALVLIPLIVIAGFIYLIYYFGHSDGKKLAEFSAAYQDFDRVILDFSTAVFASNSVGTPNTDDLEQQAVAAFNVLTTKASARISSFTRNDAEVMKIFLEIADLSDKEFVTLMAYKRGMAENNADLKKLANEFTDLTNKRQTEYARFLELGRLNQLPERDYSNN